MHEPRMGRISGKDDMSPRFLAVFPKGGCRATTKTEQLRENQGGGGGVGIKNSLSDTLGNPVHLALVLQPHHTDPRAAHLGANPS